MPTPTPFSRRRPTRVVRLLRVQQGAESHPGTNGWVSSWGTNAHGEIAGCPPPAQPSR